MQGKITDYVPLCFHDYSDFKNAVNRGSLLDEIGNRPTTESA